MTEIQGPPPLIIPEAAEFPRGTSPAQVEDAEISVVHGVGGMFSAAATVVLTNVR